MDRPALFPRPRSLPVAIIGAGYSGTIVAAKLARQGISAFLIDGSGRAGRGHAYSTSEPAHLLNVRAERMSAFADDPDHFVQRFAEAGGDAKGFAKRAFYGEYLDGILSDAVSTGRTVLVHDDAVGARRDGPAWRITLSNGEVVEARNVVLALGNQQPDAFPAFRHCGSGYIGDPWGAEAREAISEAAAGDLPVLLIGTGLTMVDAVLSLSAAGHSGRIVAVSRRGQMPLAHAEIPPVSLAVADVPLGSLLGMWRWLRRRSGEVGWQAAVDSLRHHSRAIWQSWDAVQQRRFLRHARPWWDVRRHRIAPEAGAVLAERLASGDLDVIAGRIGTVESSDEGLDVEIRLRGSGISRFDHFAFAINCTGPLHAIERTRNPLLRDLIDQGAVVPDALGIGVRVEDGAKVAGSDDLYAVGPLTKGRYWEITAVPDIREQALEIVADIVEKLGNDEQSARQRLRSR